MEELKSIMEKFAASDWDLIAVPAQQWLDGEADKNALVSAIKQADKECGNCGYELDPLYKRALELLWEYCNSFLRIRMLSSCLMAWDIQLWNTRDNLDIRRLHYNPKGAVGFFLEYYSEDHILDDIKKGLSISVLMYRETLLGQSQLRIMKYAGFLSSPLIKIRGWNGNAWFCWRNNLSASFKSYTGCFAARQKAVSQKRVQRHWI